MSSTQLTAYDKQQQQKFINQDLLSEGLDSIQRVDEYKQYQLDNWISGTVDGRYTQQELDALYGWVAEATELGTTPIDFSDNNWFDNMLIESDDENLV